MLYICFDGVVVVNIFIEFVFGRNRAIKPSYGPIHYTTCRDRRTALGCSNVGTCCLRLTFVTTEHRNLWLSGTRFFDGIIKLLFPTH